MKIRDREREKERRGGEMGSKMELIEADTSKTRTRIATITIATTKATTAK